MVATRIMSHQCSNFLTETRGGVLGPRVGGGEWRGGARGKGARPESGMSSWSFQGNLKAVDSYAPRATFTLSLQEACLLTLVSVPSLHCLVILKRTSPGGHMQRMPIPGRHGAKWR